MMKTLCGCELHEELHHRGDTAVYRGRRVADDVPVVVKVVTAHPGAAGAPVSLRHEHAILAGLSGTSAPRVHGLVRDGEHWGLLLDDTGGRSLADLDLAGALPVAQVLDHAVRITELLGDIHRQQVVHKDINPSNLVWNPDTGRLVIIDFGIATVLSHETTELVGVGSLKGTLAYMSPEQTGRMNRVVDYRTDYYSLGVTLYELLTGRLPFHARDPLKLVHCHIARQPPWLGDLVPDAPQALADIVHKLMAKDADDRYQSAAGLRADLLRCRRDLEAPGSPSTFALGRDDRSERFRLPQKLYGRDDDIARLLAAFERAGAGTATLVMVSGYSGVGKSALIRELYRPITELAGYFIAGKLDQYQNSEPYAALVQALRALVAQILTESPEGIEAWRERLLTAVQGNVQLLVDVCPELALITGVGPTTATLPPAESRVRFQQAMCDLLGAAATVEHPLCLVVDDLQWADADTLALFEELMRAVSAAPLLIIGAYRDNEVSATHPLALTVARIEDQCGPVTRVELAPLSHDAVTALVADTLALSAAEASPLAKLLAARTGGNPFFLRAFLLALHEDGLLQCTAEGWQWDRARIRQRGVTDNVVELMVARIQRLPRATQDVLILAACLGSDFDLGTLTLIADRPHGAVAHDLWAAVVAELVLVLAPVHSAVEMAAAGPELRFRFAHDRIQQAVVSTLAEGALAALHLDVARRLLDRLDPDTRMARLYDIAGHLDRGHAALGPSPDRDEVEGFARLHLAAARRALKAAAAEPAHQYARAGIALLDGDWDSHFELMRDLHIKAAEAAFLGGELDSFEAMAAIVLARVPEVAYQAVIWKLQGQSHLAQGNLLQALETYRDALARIGFPLPDAVSEEIGAREMRAVADALGQRAVEDLLDLVECTDPTICLAMELLDNMVAMAQPAASELMPIVVCRLVRLSLEHGNTRHSAFGYLLHATLLAKEDDIDRADRYGRLAMKLADRFGDKGLACQIYQYAQVLVLHWKEPLQQLLPALVHAYRQGIESGNRFYAATSALNLGIARFLAGDELGGLIADMEKYSELIQQLRQPMLLQAHQIIERAAVHLHRGLPDPAAAMAEDQTRVHGFHQANDRAMLNAHYYCKAFVHYVLGDVDEAAAAIEASENYQSVGDMLFWFAPLTLLDSLCRLAVYEHADDRDRARIRDRVTSNQARLAARLPHCPASFAHKLALVEAELFRVQGHDDDAAAAFERALVAARASGYGHETAIACEIAARFRLHMGQPERARELLREAHRGYLRWGAIAKVRVLEKQYPRLLPRVATSALDMSTRATVSTRDWDIDVLDLVGVLDASQAISREIERDRLLARLMELVIEIAGAEAGYLLLDHEGTWRVEVEKSADRDAATILGSIPLEELEDRGHRGVPAAIVRYVTLTRDNVVLDNATTDPQFGRDPYIVRHGIKSALCFALARQGGQRGILYLENNLVTGAFTPARIQVLQLLSTQAVISLENAVLYDTLEQKVASRTRELAGKNQELATTLARLRETQDRLLVQERLASLGALTAGIAHELRNPLNFVTNFAKLSAKHLATLGAELGAQAAHLEPDHARRLDRTVHNLELNLAKIVEHSQRMDEIIRAMLRHSRGGSGERANTDINALIREYVRLARPGMHARARALDIGIATELDPGLAPVMATPQELGRVLINLFDNACYALVARHAQADGDFEPRIVVRTRDLGDRVEIRVRDNGTGIPHAIRNRVLDPFFTTKHTGEGTGLGLSISHEIVTQGYGGSLTFDSEEGEFTEFVITLPKS